MIKKIKEFVFKYKFVIVAYTILLIAVLPMLNLFRFTIMNGDDFLYGGWTRPVFQDPASFFESVKIAVQRTYSDYLGWQGSFISIFLMYMQPGIFSTEFYRVVMFLMFMLCLVAPFAAVMTFNKHYLKAPPKIILPIIAMLLFVITQYMPSAFEAWYWYNGAIYYQFTFNLVLLYATFSMIHANAKKNWARVLIVVLLFILALLIGGSNYISAVPFLACYLVYLVYAFVKKYRVRKLHLILFIFVCLIFLISVLAPGNAQRALTTTQPTIPLIAIFSVKYFLAETSKWMVSTITLVSICVSMIFAKHIVENAKIKFINPFVATIFVVGVLIAQYVPTVYGLGAQGPVRCENIRFISFNIGLWVLAINLYGWLHQNDKLIKVNVLPVILLSLILVSSNLNAFPATDMWGYVALNSFISGELENFANEIEYRRELFEDESFESLEEFNYMLPHPMLQPENELWFHYGVWDFYDKTPILKEE